MGPRPKHNESLDKTDYFIKPLPIIGNTSQTTAMIYCSAAEGMCEILTISGCLPQVPSSDSWAPVGGCFFCLDAMVESVFCVSVRECLLFECSRVSSVWVPENLCYIVWGRRIRKTQEVWMDQLDTDLTRHRGSNRLAYRNNISRQIVPL